MVFSSGLGILQNALPKPADPLASIQDGLLPGQALFVQTAWVDGNGNESALSPINALILANNSTASISMAEGAVDAPATATGWNVYAGASDDRLTLQNSAVLAIGSTWEIPASG